MLTRPQLADLFDRLETPPAGQKLIANASVHAPVREVKSRDGGKVIAILTSQKMARAVQTEGRHVEFTVIVTEEHANHVREYNAQACELKLITDAPSRCTFSFGPVSTDTPC